MKALYTLLISIFSITVGSACTPGGTLNVNSNTTISATACYTDLTFSNNKTLTIESPATLTIQGSVTLNNNATIIVEAGATLEITGSLTVNNNFSLTNNGTVSFGSFDANNGVVVNVGGTGNLNVLGDFTTGTGADVDIDGTATIGGSVNVNSGGGSTFTVEGNLDITSSYTGPDFTGGGTVTENGSQTYPTTLPITLSYFGGTCNDSEIEILWVTSSENNSSHFILERSDNAEDWKAVSQMQAAGQSSEEIEYIVTDRDGARNVLSYYRLKQYDFNGDNTVYGPISVACEQPEELKPTGVLAPNPSVEASYLTISNSPLGDALITLLGSNGETIYTERVIVTKQNDSYFIDSLDLKRGSYIIRFEAPNGQVVAMKLIKN